MIHDGVDGLLYRTNDVNDAVNKIKSLLEDEKIREHLGENARKYVSEVYTSAHAGECVKNKVLALIEWIEWFNSKTMLAMFNLI